jgi:2-polyprenyl-3-methyl-5-hydroxy-6-metoxy-1,4-benzoquinol methylase
VEIGELIVDPQFLKELHAVSPDMLDEMALPSFFHKNPLVRWVTHTRLKAALKLLDFKAGMQIMDYGCGTGILFLQLPKGEAEYLGVDIHLWPAEKVLAHHKRDDIQLVQADDWSDFVADQSLDFIFATEVLEHIEDLGPIIANFARKLTPNGRIVITLPTENLIYKLGRTVAGFSGHYHRQEMPDILKTISAVGSLEIDSSASIPFPCPFCLYSVYRVSKT